MPDESGSLRVIAGEYQANKGPANTCTPINVWDIKLNAGKSLSLDLLPLHSAILIVLSGAIKINNAENVDENEYAVFAREDELILMQATVDSTVLFLGGEPLNEPVVAYGPFVMNTQEEIKQAVSDYQQGLFG